RRERQRERRGADVSGEVGGIGHGRGLLEGVGRGRAGKGEGIFDEQNNEGGGGEGDDDEGAKVPTEEEQKRAEKERKKARKKAMKEKKKRMAALSFAGDEELEDDDDPAGGGESRSDAASGTTSVLEASKRSITKNPEVDTSFLPNKEREERARSEREQLRREWLACQKVTKEEALEITYSYWDGTGHHWIVHCKKGDTVAKFLELVRGDLAREFREMGNVSSDALLYVKEDLIIPKDVSFYDLIATQARGKSGPLFNFYVHDVRIGVVDARVEKDESHPGKAWLNVFHA
ncbi:hypothetical protein ACHAWF_000345, partial [Thalassiosira exigua]